MVLMMQNNQLVQIVNEFYTTIDPLTVTYINKLIAISLPLIDRIKLYAFLVSLMPEVGEALKTFTESMVTSRYLKHIYNREINNNMRGLFYKYNDILKEKRAASIEKTKALKTAIINRANLFGQNNSAKK